MQSGEVEHQHVPARKLWTDNATVDDELASPGIHDYLPIASIDYHLAVPWLDYNLAIAAVHFYLPIAGADVPSAIRVNIQDSV